MITPPPRALSTIAATSPPWAPMPGISKVMPPTISRMRRSSPASSDGARRDDVNALRQRMLHHETYLMPAPEENHADFHAHLLRRNRDLVGATFCIGEEDAVFLVGAVPAPTVDDIELDRIVAEHRAARKYLPGFGHHLHKPDDPRTPKLFEIARANGVKGDYIHAIEVLNAAVDKAAGKHMTINATGGTAAVLSEIGISPEIMRGFAVIARAAGLVAHIAEERDVPTARFIWDIVEEEIPYSGKALDGLTGDDDGANDGGD